MKRIILLFVMSLVLSVGLAGCSKDPDALYREGKYAEAYTEYVKRGGLNEVALKTEKTNDLEKAQEELARRQQNGNQAIHDYFYAAECQKQLGNIDQANLYYGKVVDVSKCQIRTPCDKLPLLQSSYDNLIRAIDAYRSQQDYYISNYSERQTVKNGRVVTEIRAVDYYPMVASYRTLLTARQNFETVLASCNSDAIFNISEINAEYASFSSRLDQYQKVGDSTATMKNTKNVGVPAGLAYHSLKSESNILRSCITGSQGRITYIPVNITLSEPGLVKEATAILEAASSDASAQAPMAFDQNTTSSDNNATLSTILNK